MVSGESPRQHRPPLRAGELPLRVFVSSVMDEEMAQPRADAVAALDAAPFLSPWAFEFTPASTEALDESYLRHVREAEVTLWLVGSRSTPPVLREIREAIAHDRPVLIVRLSTATPDRSTEGLLREVGARVKWVETRPEGVRDAVALSFEDEFLRAWRSALPARTRAALLDERGRLSRGRCIARWRAAGLSRAEALVLADDVNVGEPSDEVRPTADNPLIILSGPVGAGKSLTTERLLQEAIARALDDPDAPVPVWIHARTVGDDLVEAIRQNSDGIGMFEHRGAFVVIDGAEEAGTATASTLLEAARIAIEAWPDLKVVISSRPLQTFSGIEETVELPAFSEESSLTLVSRVAGREVSTSGWPVSVSDAVRRPLWAILLGVDLRAGSTASSPGSLLRNVVQRAVPAADTEANQILRDLAQLSTERGEAPVRLTDLGRAQELAALRDSGLIVESEGAVRFGLPILTQWFAAESLIAGRPQSTELAEDPARLDLWRYALVVAIGELDWSSATELLEPIVRADPGFASEVVTEAIRESSDPSEGGGHVGTVLEAGRAVHRATGAWLAGVGPVRELLGVAGPDGAPLPLGVAGDNTSLMTMWRQEPDLEADVIELPPQAHIFDPGVGWGPGRLSRPAPESAWPWRWALEDVTRSLKAVVEAKRLQVHAGPLFRERAWEEALALLGHGSLHSGPIAARALEDRLVDLPADALLMASGTTYDLAALRVRLAQVQANGADELTAPWPGRDLDVEATGGWVWSPYTPERLLERTAAVYQGALEAYEQVVDRWLPTLRHRLRLAVTLPATLRGQLDVGESRGGGGAPGLSWELDPLPTTSNGSSVELTMNDRAESAFEDRMERLRLQQKRLVALRPAAHRWISAHSTSEILKIFGPTPATDLAFKWLASDLKRIRLYS